MDRAVTNKVVGMLQTDSATRGDIIETLQQVLLVLASQNNSIDLLHKRIAKLESHCQDIGKRVQELEERVGE